MSLYHFLIFSFFIFFFYFLIKNNVLIRLYGGSEVILFFQIVGNSWMTEQGKLYINKKSLTANYEKD